MVGYYQCRHISFTIDVESMALFQYSAVNIRCSQMYVERGLSGGLPAAAAAPAPAAGTSTRGSSTEDPR